MSAAAPNLADVLAAVVPGRVVRLALTPEQKRALRDPEGRLALDVLRHLLGALASSVHPGAALDFFPLTALAFQAVARKLGQSTDLGRPTDDAPGIKRCRTMIRRLRAAGILAGAGAYRKRYNRELVALFRLAARIAPLEAKRTVGRARPVKRRRPPRWWRHPLFGDPTGRAPPGLSARLRKARSHDERHPVWA